MMRSFRALGVAFCATLLSVVFVSPARADDYNEKTLITFNEPVEVPGMVLGPGTYQFRLFDSPSDRNIVRIFDRDGMHLYDTVMTIPVEREEVTGRTVITFEERAKDSPEAIHDWFYPGMLDGHEFVYPKVQRVSLAQAASPAATSSTGGQEARELGQLAEAMPAPATPATPAATPAAPAVPSAAPAAPAAAQPATSAEPATPQTESAKKELPKTASNMPLVALLGLSLLGAGLVLRAAAKQMA